MAITLQAVQIVEAVQGMNVTGFGAIEEGGFTVDTSAMDAPFAPTGNADNFDF